MKRRRVKKKVKIWGIASANTTKNMPDALLSRFIVLRFREYSREELIKEIITHAVTKRLKKPGIAEYVAQKAI